MGNLRRHTAAPQAHRRLLHASFLLIGLVACVQGQGFEDLGLGSIPVGEASPPPPPMRLSDVAKQRTFEHHAASHAHQLSNASAPAPAPLGGAPSGAPMPGQISELGLLPVVAGVAQALAPALAPSPLPLPRASVAGIDEAADAQAPRPSLADEAPLQDPGTALTGSGVQQSPSMGEGNSSMAAWGGVLSAIDVYTPPAPVPIFTPDGDVVYAGPAYSSTSSAGTARSAFDRYFWPTIALLGLIAIAVSLIWAFSKRRTARRYIDLKDTEMAMQQRETRPPHETV